MIRTPLCDLLNIEYPILQGGMAWIADGELAAAVSNGGGLGIIAAGNAPGEYVREEIRKAAASFGHEFVCDGGRDFKMGEANGHFTYVEDPDGTLIEFVETFKIPILKKFGIYLHLENRDDTKPLPSWILKCLRFMKSK